MSPVAVGFVVPGRSDTDTLPGTGGGGGGSGPGNGLPPHALSNNSAMTEDLTADIVPHILLRILLNTLPELWQKVKTPVRSSDFPSALMQRRTTAPIVVP